MRILRLTFLLLMLLHALQMYAQLLPETMTAADVEKDVSAWYDSQTSLQFYPDQDLMNTLRVKKVKHYMMSDYVGGVQKKARACTVFDRNGRLLSNVDIERPFWKQRMWKSHYFYAENGKVRVVSASPVSGTQTDSLTLNANGKIQERLSIESRRRFTYIYRETDGALLQIISADSNGGRGIVSFFYNEAKYIIKIEDLWFDSLRTDTMRLLNIVRDDKNRIVHYDYFSKYEFMYNMEDPTKIEYTWMRKDYEYDTSDRIVMHTENNNFYKSPWKTRYLYEDGHLKREERATDSTLRIREHYWTGQRDSVAENWQHRNYLGRGPASINNGYNIIVYNASGNITEFTEYINTFGGIEFRNRTVLQYDDLNRVLRRDFYEYDFLEKKIVYRTGYSAEYYANGLQKSFTSYGKDQKIQSCSHYTYRYYR